MYKRGKNTQPQKLKIIIPFVAIDTDRRDIIPISPDQLKNCAKADEDTFICMHSMVTYTEAFKSCLRRLIEGFSDNRLCPVKGIKTTNEIWQSLASDNYLCCRNPRICT